VETATAALETYTFLVRQEYKKYYTHIQAANRYEAGRLVKAQFGPRCLLIREGHAQEKS